MVPSEAPSVGADTGEHSSHGGRTDTSLPTRVTAGEAWLVMSALGVVLAPLTVWLGWLLLPMSVGFFFVAAFMAPRPAAFSGYSLGFGTASLAVLSVLAANCSERCQGPDLTWAWLAASVATVAGLGTLLFHRHAGSLR